MRCAHIQMDDRGPSTKYSALELLRGDAALWRSECRAQSYHRTERFVPNATKRTGCSDFSAWSVYELPARAADRE